MTTTNCCRSLFSAGFFQNNPWRGFSNSPTAATFRWPVLWQQPARSGLSPVTVHERLVFEQQTLTAQANAPLMAHKGCKSRRSLGLEQGYENGVRRSPSRNAPRNIAPAFGTSGAGEAVGEDSAFEITPKLPFHMVRHLPAIPVGFTRQAEASIHMLQDDPVVDRGLSVTALVDAGRRSCPNSSPGRTGAILA